MACSQLLCLIYFHHFFEYLSSYRNLQSDPRTAPLMWWGNRTVTAFSFNNLLRHFHEWSIVSGTLETPARKRIYLFSLFQTHTRLQHSFCKKRSIPLETVSFDKTYFIVLKRWKLTCIEDRVQCLEDSRAKSLSWESNHGPLTRVVFPFPQWHMTKKLACHSWVGISSRNLTKSTKELQRLDRENTRILIIPKRKKLEVIIEMWECLQLQMNVLILFPCEKLKIISEASMSLAYDLLSF